MLWWLWHAVVYVWEALAWSTGLLLSLTHAGLPWAVEAAALGTALYYVSRLRRPDQKDVDALFGPEDVGDKAERVHCIAHRGAGLDAPENTLAAFKYCADQDCNFVEFDIRSCAGGELVLLHDEGLQRLTGVDLPNVSALDWDTIKDLDVSATHPNKHRFPKVRVANLNEALDFLVERKMRMIVDVKGDDKAVINGVLGAFAARPQLYSLAAVTAFNPFTLYQIRMKDPRIVGALSYRPYCFSALTYDAENGPGLPRFSNQKLLQTASRFLDSVHALLWRSAARWCSVSAVLLHKDIVSPHEVQYWRARGVRSIGWSVNRPLEKLYWRGVLRSPYLANTLIGEPPLKSQAEAYAKGLTSDERPPSAGQAIDELLSQNKEQN